jgi:hypothetical protein
VALRTPAGRNASWPRALRYAVPLWRIAPTAHVTSLGLKRKVKARPLASTAKLPNGDRAEDGNQKKPNGDPRLVNGQPIYWDKKQCPSEHY